MWLLGASHRALQGLDVTGNVFSSARGSSKATRTPGEAGRTPQAEVARRRQGPLAAPLDPNIWTRWGASDGVPGPAGRHRISAPRVSTPPYLASSSRSARYFVARLCPHTSGTLCPPLLGGGQPAGAALLTKTSRCRRDSLKRQLQAPDRPRAAPAMLSVT